MNKRFILIGVIIIIGIGGWVVFNQQKTEPASSIQMKNSNNSSSMPGTMTVKGFNYGFSPKIIKVKQGDMVMIKLVSNDSPHTFTIDELGVNQQFTWGKDTTVMFTASKKGTFQFYCAVPSHKENGMVGKLIVE